MLAAVTVPAGTAHAAGGLQIVKLKTIWGGGFVVNIGQNEGAFAPGYQAQVWYNRPHDWNNRWVRSNGEWDNYWLYSNLYTKKCLAVTSTGYHDPLVQQNCDAADPKQLWKLDAAVGYSNGHMPIRNKWLDQQQPWPARVLTQFGTHLGSVLVMDTWFGSTYQYWRSAPCGTWFGSTNIQTPAEC